MEEDELKNILGGLCAKAINDDPEMLKKFREALLLTAVVASGISDPKSFSPAISSNNFELIRVAIPKTVCESVGIAGRCVGMSQDQSESYFVSTCIREAINSRIRENNGSGEEIKNKSIQLIKDLEEHSKCALDKILNPEK